MARRRALILKFGAIGDVVMAVPAAWALHQRGYQVDWVCGAAVNPLLQSYSWIRPIVAEDKAILTGSATAKARAIVALWRQIAGVKYDLCATLYYDSRYSLLTWPVRAERRLRLSRDSRFTQLLPGRHHTDEFMRILLGEEDSCRDTSTPPVRPDRLLPSPLAGKAAAKRIALVPAGASNMQRQQILRRWPVESYVALAALLLARGWEVVLLGGPGDEWANPYFAGLAVTNLIGRLNLPEVVSACDSCDGVVSHDTGPMHLAGLSTAAVVGIFGPTDPSMFLPRRPGVAAIWGGQGFACRPCYDGTDFAPCTFNGCMHQVLVERVLAELDRLLEAKT